MLAAFAGLAEEVQVIVLTYNAYVLSLAEAAAGGMHAVVRLDAA
ncbi:hypothetical protein [Nisaea sp.]|nr:hypothetical protein [Nisaea sp.]